MKEIFELINQMSPFILLGFLLAGLMHAFVPQNLYHRYLGGNSFRSVLNATLLGIPLPLCSCGVIPTAMSLRKEGASKGATISFLIATPQTGIDSIIATYSLMGLPFALIRPLAALVTALSGGYITSRFDIVEKESAGDKQPTKTSDRRSMKSGFWKKIRIALHYAFIEMMQDIGRWLILGLIIAGLITVFVPESFFALFANSSLLSMLLVLLFAIPMYLCATGSIPIAVALMLKGLSPGTALVLLMAGPAANAASVLVISKVMGRRTLLFYLGSIVIGAILFGLCIDYLLPREWFLEPLTTIANCHHEEISYFHLICTVLLGLLLIHALWSRYYTRCSCSQDKTSCSCQIDSNEWKLQIEGMSCNHCKNNVEKTIRTQIGVEKVEVDLNSGIATIRGNVDKEIVKKAVEALGFTCP